MRELYRSVFRRPFRQPAGRRRPKLGLTPLEGREVPAAYLVSISGMNVGETSGSNTGGLVASSTPVTADTWEGAVAAAVSGSATTGDGEVKSFPGPGFLVGTVADIMSQTSDADLGEFLDPADRVIGFEDWTDGDFDDAYWTVTATEVPVISIAKGSDAGEAGTDSGQVQNGTFTLTRTGDPSQPLDVSVTFGPPAGAAGKFATGDDYTATAAHFDAGSATATITIVPNKDNLVEGDETVRVALAGGAGYIPDASSSKSQADLTIADDPPVVHLEVMQNAIEYDPATGKAQPGIFRFVRAGGDITQSLGVGCKDDLTGSAVSGVDYTALTGGVTIEPGSNFKDVTVDPADDGLWEWQGPETVNVSLLDSTEYVSGAPVSGGLTVSEIGTPSLTPVVDGTVDESDDYSLVGNQVQVGYLVSGVGVLTHGTIVFSVQSGPGEITGPTEVPFTTDASGNAYVYTWVVPTDAADFYVGGLLRQNGPTPPASPADKPLAGAKVAGISINIFSEGGQTDPSTNLFVPSAAGHIRSITTPAAMADRIRPRIDTVVVVALGGTLPAGAVLTLNVANQSAANGTVQGGGDLQFAADPVVSGVSAASKNIRGLGQTAVGSGGNLVVKVSDKNKPAKFEPVSSSGFSVAAIPVSITMSLDKPYTATAVALADPGKYQIWFGERYAMTVESDSGVTGDLDQVSLKELVANVKIFDTSSPPVTNAGLFSGKTVSFGDFIPATDAFGDDIAVRLGDYVAASEAAAVTNGKTDFVTNAGRSAGGVW